MQTVTTVGLDIAKSVPGARTPKKRHNFHARQRGTIRHESRERAFSS